jgi:guanosine-3',5'-bis(diphosphate) 3'-pyrophosphohydrolase
MNIPRYLNSSVHERQRRLAGQKLPDPQVAVLWEQALDLVKDFSVRQRLLGAHAYACSLDYKHGGLSSAIYLSHPLRVAALGLLSDEAENDDIGVVGLLHNVLEVSQISKDDIAGKFGKDIAEQISVLTVDRSLQWDQTYKAAYYARINEGPRAARVVKIFDKLDNIFLLGLNRNADVRMKYLAEIETFVLPMVASDAPELSEYFEKLVTETRQLGFFGTVA